jgi:hypothetical protein
MRLTPLVVLAVAAVASCGGDDGGGTDAGAAGFAAMLADVPATAVEGELPMLSYVDMDLVWASLGVADDADDEARMAAFTSAPANGRFIVPPRLFDQQWLNVDRAREEIGFDALAIRRELAVDAPPSELRLVDVAVDAATIETAIAADLERPAAHGRARCRDLRRLDARRRARARAGAGLHPDHADAAARHRWPARRQR